MSVFDRMFGFLKPYAAKPAAPSEPPMSIGQWARATLKELVAIRKALERMERRQRPEA